MPTLKVGPNNTIQYVTSNGDVLSEVKFDPDTGSFRFVDGTDTPAPAEMGATSLPSIDVDGTGLTLEEDGGDLVYTDSNNNVVFRYNEDTGTWEMDSLSTEEVRINNGLDATRAKHGNVAASFEQASWGADGVQGSIDRLYGLSGGNATQILVDGSYTENVTIDTQQGTHITTWHPQSRVEYDPGAAGTATFDISVDDVDLSNLWIDGANDSSATCVYHNDRELSMRNVYLENAGKGLHADGMDELRVWGAHGQGIDNEFVDVVNTTDATLMNLEASSPIQVRGSSFNVTLANCIVHFNPGNSFLFDSQDSCIASGMVAWQPQGSGFNIKDSSVVSGISAEHGFRGVDFNGADRAVFIGAASSSDAGADVDLAFSGATKCTAIGRFDSIEFDSNSVDCRVYGSPWATVTNNGTNCSVV